LVWAIVVITSMVLVAYLAKRWGRDPFGWALLGAVMGPIALVGLAGTRQSDMQHPSPFETATPRPNGSPLLAAVDGAPASTRVANYIAAMHRPDAEVVLLTVLPHEARPGDAWAGLPDEHQRRVDAATAEAARILGEAGMRPRVVVGYGSPAEEILRCATEERAEVIILGRRGAGLTKALLGSVSDRVVREAKSPVVVVE
jgi:nucleotide-binding universal stress UspA family protein